MFKEAKFWSKVNKNGPIPKNHPELGQCWIWTGAKFKLGYGKVIINYKPCLAHRVSWTLSHGEISNRVCILHKCDNPSCVNPTHLFKGSKADNNRDRAQKGRSALGEKSGRVKLTDNQVKEIRATYQKGSTEFGSIKLGEKFGVSHRHILHIIHNKSRKENTHGVGNSSQL